MEIRTIKIKKFVEFHELVSQERQLGTLYRGVSNSDYKLIASIGRYYKKIDKDTLYDREQKVFKLFKNEAALYQDVSTLNNWDVLALAQHYGLPTRLLDWSLNPLVALFFAVSQDYNSDGSVYVAKDSVSSENWLYCNEDLLKKNDPFSLDKPYIYVPVHLTHRLKAQWGAFVIQPDPTQEYKCSNMLKLIIPAKMKADFFDILYNYDIHFKTLFPDLTGLANSLKWSHFDSNQHNQNGSHDTHSYKSNIDDEIPIL